MKHLPISTLVQWAGKIGGIEAVFIVRDESGQVRMASTHGTCESILPLLEEAVDQIGKEAPEAEPLHS